MRHLAMVLLAAALPSAGFAQEAVIRIEAKRGTEAATSAAEGWSKRFDDVVTLPLSGGWVGIALGPLPKAEADVRLAELRRAGQVPVDSFVSVPEQGLVLTPVQGAGAEDAALAEEQAPVEATEAPIAGAMDAPAIAEAPAPAPVPAAAPGSYLRLESMEDRAAAETALARWRETFPEAGLWDLPNGWFAIALGPVPETAATAWLATFKKAKLVAKDAFVSPAEEMGPVAIAGDLPDLPAPPATPVPLPSLMDIQRALRWAGHYDGGIDGKTGPRTEAAILAEITASRQSTDPGTAMRKLMERRLAWRQEMGLEALEDEASGLTLIVPLDKLQFDRTERDLSIYGPKDGSGVALILFSRPGGQQELLDIAGLTTALGWVPQPIRTIKRGHVLLEGKDAAHLGRSEGWVRDGMVEGFVLIWPAQDAENQRRIAAEMSDSLMRMPPPVVEPVAGPVTEPVAPTALPETTGEIAPVTAPALTQP